ncbi:MAG: peptidase [Mesorhizobium sp.]|nr:MAG: peptidase [Mesorhizobium sp.]
MKFLAAIFSRQGFAILLLSAVLAACTAVVVDEGPGYRPPRPGPQFCTKQYDPVCARRGGDRQTFANACLAERGGYRIIRDGQCRDGGGGGDEEQTFCTREYAPVCARRRGDLRTFPNACEARAADYRIVEDGPC